MTDILQHKPTPVGVETDLPALKEVSIILLELLELPEHRHKLVRPCDVVRFINRVSSWIKHHGWRYAVNTLKVGRLALLQRLAGTPAKHLRKMRVKRMASFHLIRGLPSYLPPLLRRGVATGQLFPIRIALTLMFVLRSIPTGVDWYPLSSITSKTKGKAPAGLDDFIIRSVTKFGWSLTIKPEEITYRQTGSSGPQGPAMLSVWGDLVSLHRPENAKTYKALLIMGLNRDKLWPSQMALRVSPEGAKAYAEASSEKSKPLRRLTYIPDKECKMRGIAIADYYSQLVLKPIHEQQARILGTLSTDYTFNQDGYKQVVKTFFDKYPISSKRPRIYSVDLKSATDRMPLEPQHLLMTCLLKNQEQADAWRHLVVGSPFVLDLRNRGVPDGSYKGTRWDTTEIRDIWYRAGQPMGLYSSWTTFTLLHHLIIMFCCDRLGLKWWESYCLLGDDALIFGQALWDEYTKVMRALDVDPQPSKTFNSVRFLEFAKRFHWKRRDITPFPLGAFYDAFHSPSLISNALDNAIAKSWLVHRGDKGGSLSKNTYDWLSACFRKVGKWNPSFSRWLAFDSLRTLRATSLVRWSRGKQSSHLRPDCPIGWTLKELSPKQGITDHRKEGARDWFISFACQRILFDRKITRDSTMLSTVLATHDFLARDIAVEIQEIPVDRRKIILGVQKFMAIITVLCKKEESPHPVLEMFKDWCGSKWQLFHFKENLVELFLDKGIDPTKLETDSVDSTLRVDLSGDPPKMEDFEDPDIVDRYLMFASQSFPDVLNGAKEKKTVTRSRKYYSDFGEFLTIVMGCNNGVLPLQPDCNIIAGLLWSQGKSQFRRTDASVPLLLRKPPRKRTSGTGKSA